MTRRIHLAALISILAVIAVFTNAMTAPTYDENDTVEYEVWVIDQSNSRDEDSNGTLDSGGKLYTYKGDDLIGEQASAAIPTVLDLGGAARDLCGSANRYLSGASAHVYVQPQRFPRRDLIRRFRTRVVHEHRDEGAHSMYRRWRPGACSHALKRSNVRCGRESKRPVVAANQYQLSNQHVHTR